MTQGLNGALRSAAHALKSRGIEHYSPERLLDEAKRVAPGCRHLTRRKVLRALARKQRKVFLRFFRNMRNDGADSRH
jgi:hypothetical protein